MIEPRGGAEPPENFIERSPWNRLWFSSALAAAAVAVDYCSGPEVIVPGYFVVPAMLMAWNCGMRAAVTLSLLLSAIHFTFLIWWGVPVGMATAVNAAMRSGVLVTLVVVTARLGIQTRSMRDRVKILEGILRTCSFCKDIRDEDGQWEKIEAYVSRHSDARFSHGICPDCAEEHYGFSLSKKISV